MELLEQAATALAEADPHEVSGQVLAEALSRLEAVESQLSAARLAVVAAIEADGTWATSGAASLNAWLREHTGRFTRETARMTTQARALRDHLPATGAALAQGKIGTDHLWTLVRHATSSPGCIQALSHPELGEQFLVEQASALDASRFDTLLKSWALRADPEAADRRWKAESDREEFSLARTTDGWHGTIWLTPANGTLVHQALQAQAGRRADGDTRSPAQRRVAALVDMAGSALDSGKLQPGARIRPHLAITAPLTTLLALAEAQAPARSLAGSRPAEVSRTGPADPGDSGRTTPDHRTDGAAEDLPVATIPVALDHDRLQGADAATLEDGTPIPFGLFAQLACESRLHRVVFGPDSEILDVGREERLFTAGQTRGIIARDGHCQFPSCAAPPGQGEIHHSLWWYAHHGSTTTANGILLCRYHHSYVHQRELLIERYPDHWRFVRNNGTTFATTRTRPVQPALR
ncbi:DUF222 domain-containing protein [Georgenia sp. 10Sc9-8]|uniref:DUF222 domain-containing protein n=1 Tax=Georgenia halotolerans TaxID=3028317 RepID=A0ABT5TXU4_9MICO|nr:DUF222 domain-containing protein [Georgenia halotolerans]